MPKKVLQHWPLVSVEQNFFPSLTNKINKLEVPPPSVLQFQPSLIFMGKARRQHREEGSKGGPLGWPPSGRTHFPRTNTLAY
jgi:hypothetical protein